MMMKNSLNSSIDKHKVWMIIGIVIVVLGLGFLLLYSPKGEVKVGQAVDTPICGDGILDTGEGCDDGNQDVGDGCGITETIQDYHWEEVCVGWVDVCDGEAIDESTGETYCTGYSQRCSQTEQQRVDDPSYEVNNLCALNSGYVCPTEGAVCVRQCTAYTDCLAGQTCQNGGCVEDDIIAPVIVATTSTTIFRWTITDEGGTGVNTASIEIKECSGSGTGQIKYQLSLTNGNVCNEDSDGVGSIAFSLVSMDRCLSGTKDILTYEPGVYCLNIRTRDGAAVPNSMDASKQITITASVPAPGCGNGVVDAGEQCDQSGETPQCSVRCNWKCFGGSSGYYNNAHMCLNDDWYSGATYFPIGNPSLVATCGVGVSTGTYGTNPVCEYVCDEEYGLRDRSCVACVAPTCDQTGVSCSGGTATTAVATGCSNGQSCVDHTCVAPTPGDTDNDGVLDNVEVAACVGKGLPNLVSSNGCWFGDSDDSGCLTVTEYNDLKTNFKAGSLPTLLVTGYNDLKTNYKSGTNNVACVLS